MTEKSCNTCWHGQACEACYLADLSEWTPEMLASPHRGETLRDRFAMAALTGLLANTTFTDAVIARETDDPPGYVSASAYAIADAMLAEREKGK